jgi:hypothetical protein
MIKKKLIILIIFLFFNGCGFSPIFNAENINININKIDFNNNKINRNFAKRISTFSNQKSNNLYDLYINSYSTKDVAAKDSKGNPSIYRLQLKVDITLINNNDKKELKKSFFENVNINNNDDKFKLKITEDTLIDQMSQKILQDILKFIANAK